MDHADKARHVGEETRWMDAVYERWEALFQSLRDEPYRAEALCSLGMKLIMEGRIGAWPYNGTNGWVSFFALLADNPEAARNLCLLGLSLVRRDLEYNERTRTQVRAILWACRPCRNQT